MPGTAYKVAYVEVSLLKEEPKPEEKLQTYALSKVAEGVDIKTRPAPGMFAFEEKEKRKAWQKLIDEKVTQADAEKKYVAFVAELKKKYGIKAEADLTDAEKKKLADARK